MEISIKSTALVMRIVQGSNGEKVLQIFGTGLEIPEQIKTNQDYLVLGSLSFDAKHIFNGFMFGEGQTPNNMITGGGLNHSNYTEKVL